MAAASGQYGKIMVGGSTLIECTGWSFDRQVAEHVYASCATGGYKKRIAGTKDGSGELRGIFDPDDPIEGYINEGDHVTLLLYFSATKYHSVPAQINSINIDTDIEEGDIVRWTAQFGINGAYTLNN